jgi:hypothetical protein
MAGIYHLRIKKDFAEVIIEDLQKMKAIELIEPKEDMIPEWQKKEVRKRIDESKQNPSILIDENTVFNMLKNRVMPIFYLKFIPHL